MLQHYILQRHQQIIENKMDFYTPTGIHVYFKDPIENKEVDLQKVVAKVEGMLPEHLMGEVEMIIIGHFEEFEERNINAFYDAGTLYLSPMQDDDADLFDDIVHEIAHSNEQPYGSFLYHDGKLEKEFLNKRLNLHKILWHMGYKLPEKAFLNTEYDKELDEFLYKTIGYDKLAVIVQGLFITPYAATSLREYFATAFTDYYVQTDHTFLKQVSPQLYKKLLSLNDPERLDNIQ